MPTLGIVFSLIPSIATVGAVLNKRLPGALEISPLMLVRDPFSAVCLHLAVPFVEDWSDTSILGLRCPYFMQVFHPCSHLYLFASVLRRASAIQGAALFT